MSAADGRATAADGRASAAGPPHLAGVPVVDSHAHIVVDELLAGLTPGVAEVREVAGRRRLFTGGRELTSVVGEFFDPVQMCRDAHRAGIDHLLLSPWVQLLPVRLPAREARRRCELQCEALSRVVELDPVHLSAVGAVPIEHPAEAVSMLRDACAAGLAGVELPAGAANYLGDDALEQFWEEAEARRALVFVHPATRGIPIGALDDHYLWNTVGNPVETTIAAAHLAMCGVLERHPDLRILLAHGGGVLPALCGRITHGQEAVAAARGRLTEPIASSLGRFYFDTITHDHRQLRRLIDDFGATRVLLGSDRPFDMGDPDPVRSVTSLGLSAEDERAVLGGNAARLLDLGAKALQL